MRPARLLPAAGAAASLVVIFIAVLSVPLNAAAELGLSEQETVGWITALYGLPGVLTIVLVWRYRQPLLVTGNIFMLIFVASLGTDVTWPELMGASLLAGVVVGLLGPLGLTTRLAAWLPAPIVYGLLSGAVLHFFVDLFSAADDKPLIVGGALVAYVVARRLTEPSLPAILPALLVGVVLAALAGELGAPAKMSFVAPAFRMPEFSAEAILTAMPVFVVLITLQANVPSLVFLREQGYVPPKTMVSATSGVGTAGGSLLGPIGVSLSLPATALCAGPDAGPTATRHWSAYIAGGMSIVIAVFAGLATEIAAAVPRQLLVALVGLAVLGILMTALRAITSGPLLLGPLFAFGISQSSLELVGLGPFFWALFGGLAVSLLLERDAMRDLRS